MIDWHFTKHAKATALAGVLSGAFFVFIGSPAHAHGFGDRYDLPVPLWLYLAGAASAVALSFVVVGVFMRGTPGLHDYPRVNILPWPAGRSLVHPLTITIVKVVAVTLFFLTVAAGLLGDRSPNENLAPTMVWVIWWVGLAYVSALLGNIWALLNPWKIIFSWAEGLYRRADQDGDLSMYQRYPRRLGILPGVVLFALFAWVEIVFPGAAEPRNLALLVAVYSVITWLGMFIFGREVWLKNGEAFSIVFGFLARFAPIEVRVTNTEICASCTLGCRTASEECVNCYDCLEFAERDQRELNVRPFGVGLLSTEGIGPSHVLFVLILLATVTFDGFTATPLWAGFVTRVYPALAGFGPASLTALETLGLLFFPMAFIAVYLMFASLMAVASGEPIATSTLARAFITSLIPIALAYHLAHFLSFLLIQGQRLIPLASDPFAYGWDLLGTADYQVNIGIIDARFAWFTSVAAIVLGHIIAVYIAHVGAMRLFSSRQAALRSQYPMLALMVGYTVVSLWILAQPITEATVRI